MSYSSMITKILRIVLVSGCVLIAAAGAQAEEAQIARGRGLAQANCARCPAIGATGESALAKAPPFRTLHNRYPIENLEEALAEGIRTAHPEMPAFELNPDQINDLIAYLKSLERNG